MKMISLNSEMNISNKNLLSLVRERIEVRVTNTDQVCLVPTI